MLRPTTALRPALTLCLGCALLLPSGAAAQDAPAQGTRFDYGLDIFGVRIHRPGPALPAGPALSVQLTGSVRGQGDLRAELRPFGYDTPWFVRGQLSSLQRNRFYGWGNLTDATNPAAYHQLEQALGEITAGFERTVVPGLTLTAGPRFRWRFTDPESELGDHPEEVTIISTMRPFGVGSFGQLGMFGGVEYLRAGPAPAGQIAGGVRLELEGAYYPAWLAQSRPMASTTVQVAVSRNLGWAGNLSLRAGAEKRWGGFPFMDAAFLGGRRSLRGFEKQRFAGDAAVWAATDLHLPGASVPVAGRRVQAGPLVTLDVGRVYFDGQSAGGWHLGRGLGIWALDGASGRYVSASLSWGDGSPRAYLNIGVPLFR